jgi:hypothetical protein
VLLKFLIFDKEKNVSVEMFSRTKKVDLTDEFIGFLKEREEIEYKVS